MIPLAEITPKMRSLIAGNSFFDGVPVVENLGLSGAQIEKGLTSVGVVVVVNPILGGTGPTQAGMATSRAKISVSIRINPSINPTGLQINIYEAITEVCSAVLAFVPQPGDSKFELDPEDQFGLEDFNDSLLAYSVSFVKKTQLV